MSSTPTHDGQSDITGGQSGSQREEGSTEATSCRSGPRHDWFQSAKQILSVESFWYGLIALLIALHGQRILMPGQDVALNPDFTAAKRWYVLAIGVMLYGWWNSYTSHSMLARGRDAGWNVVERLRERANVVRIVIVAVAVIANLVAIRILNGDWYSAFGGWLWAISMLMLVLACLRERPEVESVDEETAAEKASWSIPRWAEAIALVGILALAVTMRVWRLGDLHPGMHGDEGEAGSIALSILNGVPISPFLRGWFTHSNIYFWSVAVCMKIFGTGLIGLRSWAVICGLVTVLFVYLIAREMFGVRAAIIAGFLIAFQSADVLMSRQLSSNAATPAFTAMAFYFLIRGLKTKKHMHFIVAGLAAGFNVYSFAGGRLTAPSILAFMAYMAALHRAFLRHYWTRVAAFGVAVAAAITPLVAYNRAYPLPPNAYPNDRFVWQNHDLLATIYGASDWRTILSDQVQRTLSMFTWSADNSANHILDYPIARPLEAVLIVLGLVWAAWRWKDARFTLLSVWFWSAVIVGGVLTIDAPNVPRIVGALPALPILIAAWLDHFGGQLQTAIAKATTSASKVVAPALSSAAIGGIVLVSGFQNWDKYINYYLHTHTQPDVTEQAIYVQATGLKYRYYDMGAPAIYFGHGDNRFINPHADGIDSLNPSSIFPITDNGANGERDVDFLVWGVMSDYTAVLRAYYPEGKEQIHPFGDPQQINPILVSYTITHQQIDKHRVLRVRFVPKQGSAIAGTATSLGLTTSPPAGLSYPVRATWTGAIVTPVYGPYQFRVVGAPGANLQIDGSPVSPGPGGAPSQASLGQGVHSVQLTASLQNPSERVHVEWAQSGASMAPIQRRFLWDDHIGRSWKGEITLPGVQGPIGKRVDGFLGFRATQVGLAAGSGIDGRWISNLHIARQGTYGFELNSNGTSSLTIDGKPVITNLGDGGPHAASGSLYLQRGTHHVVVAYTWQVGVGYLEAWWTPPGEQRQFMVSPLFRAPK